MKFSVVVICRDEENSLPGLLESLTEFRRRGGKTVIVDTGSKDPGYLLQAQACSGTTVVMAGGRFNIKVHEDEARIVNELLERNEEAPVVAAGDEVFDFSAARNYAASLSPTDFVLYLDADERITCDLESAEKEMTEGRGLLRTWIKAGQEKWLTTRLYNRKHYEFQGICHEGLYGTVPSTEATLPEDGLFIEHHQLPKAERPDRIKGLALQYHRDPSPRWMHYYARDLMYRGRYKSAIELFEKHAATKAWAEECAQSLAYVGDCWKAIGDMPRARDAWERCYSAAPERRVGIMRLAEDAYAKADWPLVELYAQKALDIDYSGKYLENMAEYGSRPYELLYPALWQTGDTWGSGEAYHEARRLNPDDRKVRTDGRWYDRPLVSVVIPAIGHPDKLEACRKSIREQSYSPIEVVIHYDHLADRQGCPKTLAAGVELANGDLVAFVGQDCRLEKDYVAKAVDAMRQSFPEMDGMVGTNDGHHGERLATHWLASKKLLPALGGYFFHPDYEHSYADNELMERCRLMGKYAYAADARLYHDNPIIKGGEQDDVSRIVSDPDRFERDRQTYLRRKAVWSLPFTGERVVPDKMQGYEPTLEEHMARYEWAKDHLTGGLQMRVLDAPCGTGYGTRMMFGHTGPGGPSKVFLGCDISTEAVAYANEKYAAPGITYIVSDLEKLEGALFLPDADPNLGTVVSFEGLEHLADPRPFLKWAKVHAKRMIWSIPVNNPSQFHKVVYSVQEIKDLMEGELGTDVQYFSQNGTDISPMKEGDSPQFVLGVHNF